MFCSNCGKQIEDENKFCPACGQKLIKEDCIEKTDEYPAGEFKEVATPPTKKKIKITKKFVVIVSSIAAAIAVITTLVILIFSVFIPSARWNKAVDLMNAEKYEEAYKLMHEEHERYSRKYDSSIAEECYIKAIHQMIENGKIEDAVEFRMTFYFDRLRLPFNDENIKNSIKFNEDELYNGIIKVLNDDNTNLSDYKDEDTELLAYIISLLPQNYAEDVKYLSLFLSDLCALEGGWAEGFDYVSSNHPLIEKIWKYKAVRNFIMADQNIDAFLVLGKWDTLDGSLYMEFEYRKNGNSFTITYGTNIPTPNVSHRYYDVENMLFVFENANNAKVCDVFKLEFDETDPRKMNVYCYENQETYTLYR